MIGPNGGDVFSISFVLAKQDESLSLHTLMTEALNHEEAVGIAWKIGTEITECPENDFVTCILADASYSEVLDKTSNFTIG